MTKILDQFTDYGRYTGEPQEGINETNFDELRKQKGEEWVAGYIRAMEIVLINLADILEPDPICGTSATKHMVRKHVREYWNHNVEVFKSFSNQIETCSRTPEKPQVD